MSASDPRSLPDPACRRFRADLGRELAGVAGDLAPLGWHEHLLGCDACRALLEHEQALEHLLDSLPRPTLPPELVARVLARLRVGLQSDGAPGGDHLWELLGREAAPRAPEGLGARVLAGVRAERALDGLLDRALLEVAGPANLSARVLAGLRARVDGSAPLAPNTVHAAPDRRSRAGRPEITVPDRRPLGPRRRLAAVLVVLLSLAGWRVLSGRRGDGAPDGSLERGTEVAQAPLLPRADEELLVWMDVLERMEVIEQVEPVELDLVTFLDPSDELLLELLADSGTEEDR